VAALGLYPFIEGGRFTVVGVTISGTEPNLTGKEVFRYRADAQEDHPLQLAGLMGAFSAALGAIAPEAIVVRSMDFSGRSGGLTVEKATKLEVEGILLAVSRRAVAKVEKLRGNDIALKLGTNKLTAENRAEAIFASKGLREVGAAALAALELANSG